MVTTAFHSGLLGDFPVLDAVRVIKDYGYDAAELNGEILPWAAPHVGPDTGRAVRQELAQLGPFAALSAHHADFGSSDAARNERSLEHTIGMLELASDLGIGVVHVIAGEGAAADPLRRSLHAALAVADRLAISLSLEPIVNRLIGTRRSAEDLLEDIPALGLNFDPSHLQVMDGDVVGAARALATRVNHVHLKDASGSPNAFEFNQLGKGAVDFDGMLLEIFAAGFDGAISIEHESHYFSTDTRPLNQVLEESRLFLEALIERTTPPSRL
ncbi:sugar phosphate isomerase/epimerase family protein [Pseudorhodoplanes sp.]|uniref:sugar phosphate isomerase/epimerase family protein n=1 Tax=Pseudorhodoplanes sp. TaxID=1934341 RepID=UPI002C26E24F|nr:sugar phosphate isomerase/epimerase family protein [Pseudorhodoplanes sp.]HWV55805.1 sugar phosphate isomerase/epimerase family protein [Pseudorhodoplanes sp.]